MRYLLILLTLVANSLEAQTFLKFDNRLVDCEDRWVAFQMNQDSTYNYGFIYFDSQAGLTLNSEGHFSISQSGQLLPEKIEAAGIKVRLQPNSVLVAFIPESKYEELKIKAIPDWLQYYKTDTASVERLYRVGYMYNAWNECAKAIPFLEKAQKNDSKFNGIDVELAFSYNCLKQFDKAILILNSALERNPTDSYLNKELIYALLKSGQIDKATESCKKAINACNDTTYNGENCYNILYAYYLRRDRVNFDIWSKEARRWNADNVRLTNAIKGMELELIKTGR